MTRRRKQARKPKYPGYRLHKPSGQAVVTLSGHHEHYLGRHGTPESRSEYDRLIREWLARSRRPPEEGEELTVTQLMGAYWRFARSYYVQDEGES